MLKIGHPWILVQDNPKMKNNFKLYAQKGPLGVNNIVNEWIVRKRKLHLRYNDKR